MVQRVKSPSWWVRIRRAVAGFFAAVLSGFRRTTGTIERTVESAAARAVDTAQQAQQFDAAFRRWGRGLLWPFRRMASLAQALLPGSFVRALAGLGTTLGRVFARVGSAAIALAQKLNLDRAVLLLVRGTRPVWLPLLALGRFVVLWAQTRDYKKLLWGIPALVLLLPFAYVGARVAISGSGGIVGRYQRAVNEAFENEDFQAVALYQRKLQQLGADTSMAEYRAAETLFTEGKIEDSLARMRAIAQGQGRGAAVAAYWIAQHVLDGKFELPQDERLPLAGQHLDRLEELVGDRDASVKYLRAVWLIQKEELEQAADLLRDVVADQPSVAFERMLVDVQLRRMDEARGDARMVRRYYTDQQRRAATLTTADYSRWAAAEELLGDASRLTDVLDTWKGQFPDDPALRDALAASYLRQLQSLLRSPAPEPAALAEAIIGTTVHSPENGATVEQIVNQFMQQRKTSAAARAVVMELARRADLPAALWRILGTAACVQGDLAEARQWLARAVDLDPQDAVARNNYAWLLANSEPRALDDALTLVNEALARQPDEFRFRETRGQILVQLERWEDAIADLEFALNGIPDSANIHKSLARAYRATGQAELAAFHEERQGTNGE